MKLLTLNIGAASVERAYGIADWVEGQAADVVVLTETSTGHGTRLLFNRLLGAGYAVEINWPHGDRGVLVASRFSQTRPLPVQSTLPWRATGIALGGTSETYIIGVYGPSRSTKNRPRKEVFFTSLLEYIESLGTDRLVLIGDYNAIPRDHDPRHAGFRDFEYAFHDGLAELGLSSAHGDPQPHSWFGRSGAGYLYDYVHIGPSLAASRCEYDDEPRHLGLSDHCAVFAEVAS